jgi:hypothetical protein
MESATAIACARRALSLESLLSAWSTWWNTVADGATANVTPSFHSLHPSSVSSPPHCLNLSEKPPTASNVDRVTDTFELTKALKASLPVRSQRLRE